jgi:hypothetical protein
MDARKHTHQAFRGGGRRKEETKAKQTLDRAARSSLLPLPLLPPRFASRYTSGRPPPPHRQLLSKLWGFAPDWPTELRWNDPGADDMAESTGVFGFVVGGLFTAQPRWARRPASRPSMCTYFWGLRDMVKSRRWRPPFKGRRIRLGFASIEERGARLGASSCVRYASQDRIRCL